MPVASRRVRLCVWHTMGKKKPSSGKQPDIMSAMQSKSSSIAKTRNIARASKIANDVKHTYIMKVRSGEMKAAAVASKLGVSASAVSQWLKWPQDKVDKLMSNPAAMNLRAGGFPKLEEKLKFWAMSIFERGGILLTPLAFRVKAVKLARQYPGLVDYAEVVDSLEPAAGGADEEEDEMQYEPDDRRKFIASRGWYHRFSKRHNLVCVNLHGEGLDAAAVAQTPECMDRMAMIRDLCNEFEPRNIYNMDETGLYYRLVPNKAVVSRTHKHSVRGRKKDKARVTIVVCINATGDHVITPTMIGTAKVRVYGLVYICRHTGMRAGVSLSYRTYHIYIYTNDF